MKSRFYLLGLVIVSLLFSCASQQIIVNENRSEDVKLLSKDFYDKTVKTLLFMDLTLADVPETKIEEFASSPMYDLYLNAFILFDLYDPIPSTMARTSEGEYLIDSSSITNLLSILLFMKDFTQYLPTSKREIFEKSPEYRLFHEVIEYYKKL